MAHILIIDDDRLICETIANVVKRMGHEATSCFNLKQGREAADALGVDVILLDVRLPDGSGLNELPRLQAAPSLPEVIILTGYGDPDGAELAIRHGAWDYIQKPSTIEALTLPLLRALQFREEKKARKIVVPFNREGIIGNSPGIRQCLALMGEIAHSDANVLITGETGTGKELFALAVHKNSGRSKGNFVVVDCAALPENLVESILFGHEKGAYTGADRAREGLVLQADRGTLFLDEVGELPLSIQKRFLRVLQGKKFRPVGANGEIDSDFRLIAASNRNLDQMVRQNHFREDLLFRLRSFSLELPSLRKRKEDIDDLAVYYTRELCRRYDIEPKEFSPEFLDALRSYPWPGNVREFINALERTLIAGRYDRVLFPKHLPTHIRIQMVRSSLGETPHSEAPPSYSCKGYRDIQDMREKVLQEAEKRYLADLVACTGGSIQEACAISGLSRSRLYTLLKKHNLPI